jgi:hypothetical protein
MEISHLEASVHDLNISSVPGKDGASQCTP